MCNLFLDIGSEKQIMPNQNALLSQPKREWHRVKFERVLRKIAYLAGIGSAIANTLGNERREQGGREHVGWAHVCRALYLAVALADA